MNIAAEKDYIYGMMKDITDERRRLTEMYMSLKIRLDELNRLEERGVDTLATKGFFDMINDKSNRTEVQNIQREVSAALERHKPVTYEQKTLFDTVEPVKSTIEKPELPSPRYEKDLDHLEQRKRDKEEDVKKRALAEAEKVLAQVAATRNPPPIAETPMIRAKDIQETIDKDVRNASIKPKPAKEPKKPRKKMGRDGLSQTEATEIIMEILKDGEPMHSINEVYPKFLEKIDYEKYPITPSNFGNNIINRACRAEPDKIISLGNRMYQLKK